jgi:tetratricopeptide (TPR) repeat protein
MSREKYVAALVCARKALNMTPRSVDALHVLGSILLQTEKYNEAEAWLQKALDLAAASSSEARRPLSRQRAQEAPPMPDDTDRPAQRPRVIIQAPAPRDRKAKLYDELDRLARGPDGYTYREIGEGARELDKYQRKQEKHEDNQGLIEMAKLMAADDDMGHYEAALKVSGETSNHDPVARRLTRKFKEVAKKYLKNRWMIDDLFMGHSPYFIKQFTDEDHLNFELMYLNLCRPGFLAQICGNFPD